MQRIKGADVLDWLYQATAPAFHPLALWALRRKLYGKNESGTGIQGAR